MPLFKKFLKLLRRLIDNMLGIWICNQCKRCTPPICPHWKAFKAKVNSYGQLRWEFTKPSKECVFLDLTIKIEDGRIVTRTYQKPMNLFLYLPGPSAHPHGCIKGTIHSLLRRYYEQNSKRSDYVHFAVTLYRNLLLRAHRSDVIRPIFLEAHAQITREARLQPTTRPDAIPRDNPTERQLFLHLTYHPNDIPRPVVRRIFDKHCSGLLKDLGVGPVTIAYARPHNIRDRIAPTKLHEAPDKPAAFYMREHDQGLDP